MTDREEHRFSMYLTVDDLLLQNTSITNPLPNFPAISGEFHGCIQKITSVRGTQELDKTGITAKKNLLRDELIQKLLDILRKIEAYAVVSANIQLEHEVHYTESSLKYTGDSILMDICLVIHERAKTNLEALNTYGITDTVLTAFLNDITNFALTIPKPRAGRVEKKGATASLKETFTEADNLLIKIDALIEVVRLTQPEFYKNYKNSRIIIDTGRRIALKGAALEKTTGVPVKGVEFSFTNNDPAIKAINGNIVIVKKTHNKGRFYIKSIEKGTYTVTASKVGYKAKEVVVNVADGELADLIVEMERA